MAKKQQRRFKSKAIKKSIGIFLIITSIIAVIIVLFHNSNKIEEEPKETVKVDSVVSDGEYLLIGLEDCTLYVGTELTLTCESEPVEYGQQVLWSSNDSNIVSVDENGFIKVEAEGTVAITATYGVLSDSVIINAVYEGNVVEDSEFPIYNVIDGEVVPEETKPQEDDSNSTAETAAEETIPNNSETQGNESQDTIEDREEETEKTEEEIDYKEDIEQNILQYGFEPYVEDTYIYMEDGNYLGQAIISSNSTQIYIMTRTVGFDSNMKGILSTILPTSYENVYSSFINSETDRTLTADGLKVRIVVAQNDDHSQLIIYY